MKPANQQQQQRVLSNGDAVLPRGTTSDGDGDDNDDAAGPRRTDAETDGDEELRAVNPEMSDQFMMDHFAQRNINRQGPSTNPGFRWVRKDEFVGHHNERTDADRRMFLGTNGRVLHPTRMASNPARFGKYDSGKSDSSRGETCTGGSMVVSVDMESARDARQVDMEFLVMDHPAREYTFITWEQVEGAIGLDFEAFAARVDGSAYVARLATQPAVVDIYTGVMSLIHGGIVQTLQASDRGAPVLLVHEPSYQAALAAAAAGSASVLDRSVDDYAADESEKREAWAPPGWQDDQDSCVDSDDLKQILTVAGIAAVAVGILLIVILVPVSFCGIERQRMGFKWNKHFRVDTSEVHPNGNYFWGPLAESIQYPTTWRKVCFSRDDLEVAVSSGQVLQIEACFRYQLQASSLKAVFESYGNNEERAISSVARGALKNAAPLFTFAQYVTSRDVVAAGLQLAVQDALAAARIQVFMPPSGFVLGYVQLPQPVLSLNRRVFYESQKQLQNGFEKDATVQRLVTSLNESAINASATRVVAAANAVAEQMRRSAALKGTARLRAETGSLLQALSTRLGVTTSEGRALLTKFSLLLAAFEGEALGVATNASVVANPSSNVMLLDDSQRAVIPEF